MTDIRHEEPVRLEQLTRAECLERLAVGSYVGRVGFMLDGHPMILPVNYIADGESVVFRTAEGTPLSTLDGAAVAFEVDTNQPLEHAGWSVLVQGSVTRITDADDLERLRRGALRAWGRQRADEWRRISIDSISGRSVNSGGID